LIKWGQKPKRGLGPNNVIARYSCIGPPLAFAKRKITSSCSVLIGGERPKDDVTSQATIKALPEYD
jgi:hypothetical protein